MTNFQDRAIELVVDYYNNHTRPIATGVIRVIEPKNVFVVWFTKTLGNWKAMVSTDQPDGRYYEVTYNGAKGETYLDVYKKVTNRRVPDGRRLYAAEVIPETESASAPSLDRDVVSVRVRETGLNARAFYYDGENLYLVRKFLSGLVPESFPKPHGEACWFIRDDDWFNTATPSQFRANFDLL